MVKQIVPWSCSEEWKRVFDLLFSGNDEEQQLGVDIVEIWKIRSAGSTKLSLSIQLTSDLVQAFLVFKSEGASNAVMLMLSAVFIRFVSLISDLDQVKKNRQPVSKVFSELGIPVWISELRNDSAHASLPSVDVTTAALKTCLNYLKESYWFPHWHILYEMSDQSGAKVQKIVQLWLAKDIEEKQLKRELHKMCINAKSSTLRHVVQVIESMLPLHKFEISEQFWNPFTDLFGNDFMFSILSSEKVCLYSLFPELFNKYYEALNLDTGQSVTLLKTCLRSKNLELLSSKEFSNFVALNFADSSVDVKPLLAAMNCLKGETELSFDEVSENHVNKLQEKLTEIDEMLQSYPRSSTNSASKELNYNALNLLIH